MTAWDGVPLHSILRVTNSALERNGKEVLKQSRAAMVMKVAAAAVPVLDALSRGQEGDRGEIVRGPLHQIVLSGGEHQPTPQ